MRKLNFENETKLFDELYEPMLLCCSNCFAYCYCGGGCPVDMKRNNDGTFRNESNSAYCDIMKRYVANKIRQVVKGRPSSWIRSEHLLDFSTENVKIFAFEDQ